MIRIPKNIKLERWEYILINITKAGYWILPVLCWCLVLFIGSFYNVFGMITKSEWMALFVISYVVLGLWALALFARICLFLATKKEAAYKSQIKEMDQTQIIQQKDKHLKICTGIKKFGEKYLFLLRVSVALVVFDLLFCFYLHVWYRIV